MRSALMERVLKGQDAERVAALCEELRELARREEEKAAAEASRTPYWRPCPPSVADHRIAARVLRAGAERLEAEVRSWNLAT